MKHLGDGWDTCTLVRQVVGVEQHKHDDDCVDQPRPATSYITLVLFRISTRLALHEAAAKANAA